MHPAQSVVSKINNSVLTASYFEILSQVAYAATNLLLRNSMQQLQSNMFHVSFVSMISSFYIQKDKDKVWHVLDAHSQHWPAFVTNPFYLFIPLQMKNCVRLDPSLSLNSDMIRGMGLDCIVDGLR